MSNNNSNNSPSPTTRGPLSSKIVLTKDDPEKLYQLVELVGTGSYGEVFKVFLILSVSDMSLRWLCVLHLRKCHRH